MTLDDKKSEEESELDPELLQTLEDIRQEVEDMAYDKLRSVLSDFSLKGSQLSASLQKHKTYIQEKAHEIVLQRLEEMHIMITEAEFWCICGRQRRPYSQTHPKRPPLFDVTGQMKDRSLSDLVPPIESQESITLSTLGKLRSDARELYSINDKRESVYQGEGWSTDEAEFDLRDNSIIINKSKISSERQSIFGGIVKQPLKTEASDELQIVESGSAHLARTKMMTGGFTGGQLNLLEAFSREMTSEKSTSVDAIQGSGKSQSSYEDDSTERLDKEDEYSRADDVEHNLEKLRKWHDADEEQPMLGEYDYGYYPNKESDSVWILRILDDLIDVQLDKAIEDSRRYEKDILRAQKLEDFSKLLGSPELSATSGSIIDEFSNQDTAYLQKAFGNSLALALSEVTMKMPTSPLPYLAQYLMFYKRDEQFDKQKRMGYNQVFTEVANRKESINKLRLQLKSLIYRGEYMQKPASGQAYTFNNVAKISMRRGRRLRKAIVSVCDKFLELSPLHFLSRTIRKNQTCKNTIRYLSILLIDLNREIHYVKQETIVKIYNTVVDFLIPILPELKLEEHAQISNAMISTLSIEAMEAEARSKKLKSESTEVLEECEYKEPEQLKKVSKTKSSPQEIYKLVNKFRGKTNPYPCMQADQKDLYKCQGKTDRDLEKSIYESEQDAMMRMLREVHKPLTEINHIDREQACMMCAKVLEIIKNICDTERQLKSRLVELVRGRYITIGVDSMYENHYRVVSSISSDDREILQKVLDFLDVLIEFQSPRDIPVIRKELSDYIDSLLEKQKVRLLHFKDDKKAFAVRTLQERLEALADCVQKDVEEVPCTCVEDTAKEQHSDDSWSDDEDGVLEAIDQEQMNRAVFRIARAVEAIKLRGQNVAEIQRILESYLTRAHRPQPYLSKRANQDMISLRRAVAGLFGTLQEHSSESSLLLHTDEYVCAENPCICKSVLQTSKVMVSGYSKMLREFDNHRQKERDEIELEIMRMFCSFVDDLTLEKIQKQNLCAGLSNF